MDKKQFTPIYKKFTNSDVRGTAEEHVVWYISEYLDKEYGFNLHKLINDATGKENYKDTYTENLRNEIPKNFCLYPFAAFSLDNAGRPRICCNNNGWDRLEENNNFSERNLSFSFFSIIR
jgi:hypothetical protein